MLNEILKVKLLLAMCCSAVALDTRADDPPSIGQQIFSTHCYLCHGDAGKGDGRMARLLKSKPTNLTVSSLNNIDLNKIISLGGAAVGRSPQMPGWANQFDEQKIKSLVAYINQLREPCKNAVLVNE